MLITITTIAFASLKIMFFLGGIEIKNKEVKKEDLFYTPPIALQPLLEYLRKDWTIWEPACGGNHLVRELRKNDYSVIGTDLNKANESHQIDFIKCNPPDFDCIVTNPPYSITDKFLQRAFGLGKPFAMLLKSNCISGITRQNLFREHGIQIITLGGRVEYKTPHGKESKPNFETAWFTWGLNLPEQIIFETLPYYGMKPILKQL